MNISDIFKQHNVLLPNGKINNNVFKIVNNRGDLLEYVLSNTPHVIGNLQDTIRERIFCILHEITKPVLCKECGTTLKFKNEYRTFCSYKCASKNIEVKEMRLQTNNVRYGGNAPMCSDDIKHKAVTTSLSKYHTEYHQQSVEGRQVRYDTNKIRYGGISPFSCKTIQQKISDTCYTRTGWHHFSNSHIPIEIHKLLNNPEWLNIEHNIKAKTIQKIANELNVSTHCILTYFKKYNVNITRFNISSEHNEILQFIQSITNSNILVNNRDVINPSELDIYIPELKLAFEINGVYWHSELNGRDKSYHINKTNMCAEVGVRLLHIWDWEWIHKKNIVESRIQNILGHSTKIYARNCKISEIPYSVAAEFLQGTHIQGTVRSTINIGLFHGMDLISVMTFSKPRYTKNIEWELIRFSNKLNHTNIGGASKLFKYFVKVYKPKSIISYSDRRWNTGGLYNMLGFVNSGISAPNYKYFHNNKVLELYSRQQFQKHKLKNMLEIFDSNLTEWQNMVNNGYNRIWDCGNLVFNWTSTL
jgi:hypothetical protein